MKTKKSELLTFMSLYTVNGLYTDQKGNEFNIYVSGEKKEVDKFIRYQKRQLAKGIIGIKATVEPDNSPRRKSTEQKGKRINSKLEFKSGKVKIGISRRKIVTKRPYQITYHIDPKIKTPPETVGLNSQIQAVPDFEFEFDGPTANVGCTVQSGIVEFSLVEVGKEIKPAAGPVKLDDTNNQTGTLIATANGPIQKWRVLATGKRPGKESVFVLEYTKKF